MSEFSLASAQKASLNFSAIDNHQGYTDPYDALKYNRIIDGTPSKPAQAIYSIDSNKLYQRVHRDELQDIRKITLGCRTSHQGMTMWDVLFNEDIRSGLSSCIFLAKANYAPLWKYDVARVSYYLNYKLPISRVELNKVQIGNRVGIGIYSSRTRKTFVLLYKITSVCVVAVDGSSATDHLASGVNCDLEQVYVVNSDGQADVATVSESVLNNAYTEGFVQHLVSCSRNITTAFPWKAHFRPFNGDVTMKRDELEERFAEEINDHAKCSYYEFEDACRRVYNSMRPDRQQRTHRDGAKRDGEPKVKSAKPAKFTPPELPIVEAVSLDGKTVFANIRLKDGKTESFMFDTETFDSAAAIMEPFLVAKDIEGKIISELGTVMLLNEEKFGPNAILRYFTVHF